MDAAGLFCRFALAAHFCVLGALPLIALGKSSSREWLLVRVPTRSCVGRSRSEALEPALAHRQEHVLGGRLRLPAHVSPAPRTESSTHLTFACAVPSLPSLAVTGGVASLQLLGGLAIAAPGGELCGGVMLVAYQVLAAYEVLPALTLPVDPAAWAPFLRELALLGAIGLVFGYALERKRSKTAVPAGGSKKTA